MIELIEVQRTLRENATARESSRLLIECEVRLLGATVHWYAQRAFLHVA